MASSGIKLFSGPELERVLQERARKPPLAVGVPPFDAEGGLARGSLIEATGPRSSGRLAIILAALAAATRAGESAALVDLGDNLDPQGAEAAGVDLARLLWLRPRRFKDALLAAELLLLAGFSLVALDLGASGGPGRAFEAAWLRLARAAENQKAVLLLSSPRRLSGSAAHAVVTIESARPVWSGGGACPRLLSGVAARWKWHGRRGLRAESGGTLSLPYGEGR